MPAKNAGTVNLLGIFIQRTSQNVHSAVNPGGEIRGQVETREREKDEHEKDGHDKDEHGKEKHDKDDH